jgi:hypothetical protein
VFRNILSCPFAKRLCFEFFQKLAQWICTLVKANVIGIVIVVVVEVVGMVGVVIVVGHLIKTFYELFYGDMQHASLLLTANCKLYF